MFQYNGLEQNYRKRIKYAIAKWDIAFIMLHTENIFSLLQNLEGENIADNKVSECTREKHLQLTLICHAIPVLLTFPLSAYFIQFLRFLAVRGFHCLRTLDHGVKRRRNKSYKFDCATCCKLQMNPLSTE